MRPEELLPTKRTLSIGSRVPPAVTSTFRPRRPERRGGACARAGRRAPARTRRAARGLGQAPDALLALRRQPPDVGLDDRSRRARAACAGSPAWRGARTCGCSSPARAPAGTSAASAQLLSRLSARPAASLAIVLAEAGAITYTSALATSCRWLSGSCVGRRLVGERAARGVALELADEHRRAGQRGERGLPTKRRLAGVCTTRTACPAAVARRTSSSALYAAMPPLTPSRIRDMTTGCRAPPRLASAGGRLREAATSGAARERAAVAPAATCSGTSSFLLLPPRGRS